MHTKESVLTSTAVQAKATSAKGIGVAQRGEHNADHQTLLNATTFAGPSSTLNATHG
jgi:hypothetical protein